ncbi:latexin isoform X1 [Synchiropus splendidus]|uniref:latexin isoform X1 n=1 Tax=Synchiropus splendidus TaxID=270530 RepID=UPI00237E8111|nr:latexin isoform X1 [Synchiropus splendidus]
MTLWLVFVSVAFATAVESGTINSTDQSTSAQVTVKQTEQQESIVEQLAEDVMATGDLNPSHYPAQRAAKVVQHHLNTRFGSPYKVFGLRTVNSGYAEDVENSGRRYKLELTVQEFLSNSSVKCSAEVFFPTEKGQGAPQVDVTGEDFQKINASEEEEALYQKYKANTELLSADHLPDSHGHMEPEMKPFWHLGSVASSFVMLQESTEETLYNMAQVANVTQLETEKEQLQFDYHVLLHDMVSQEIIHWKLLVTWSPAEGVKVPQMTKLPHRHQ